MERSLLHRFKSSKVKRFKIFGVLAFSVVELLNLLNFELASAQTPFYQGKTIKLVVGSSTGGGYDLWARLLARY